MLVTDTGSSENIGKKSCFVEGVQWNIHKMFQIAVYQVPPIHENPLMRLSVMLRTGKQTDKQTKRDENINFAFSGGKYYIHMQNRLRKAHENVAVLTCTYMINNVLLRTQFLSMQHFFAIAICIYIEHRMNQHIYIEREHRMNHLVKNIGSLLCNSIRLNGQASEASVQPTCVLV